MWCIVKDTKYILVTPRLRRVLPLDMIIKDYVIGNGITADVVSLRDLLIHMGINKNEMERIDRGRTKKGLPRMFDDEV